VAPVLAAPVATDGKGPGDSDDAVPTSLAPVPAQSGLSDTLKSSEELGEQRQPGVPDPIAQEGPSPSTAQLGGPAAFASKPEEVAKAAPAKSDEGGKTALSKPDEGAAAGSKGPNAAAGKRTVRKPIAFPGDGGSK
jgi:hypothetical protein